ncbi:MAG: dUTP diphosphatase [Oligoflexia bacterium]|nr:dUTP diphosphatase [Oligoflexia bacterium]
MKPIIKIKKLGNFVGKIPGYQSEEASGADVCAALQTAVILEPGKRVLVSTGLSLEIPQGFEIQVRPRSGLAIKSGITLVNTPGTIDSDYRGELKIIIINHGQDNFVINPGDRIAQLIVAPVIQAEFQEVGEISTTVRGKEGFGSTGVNV